MQTELSRYTIAYGAVFFVLSFLLILPACEKDKYQHPVIHTGEVTGISQEGALFHGRIIEMGSEKIVDHGFVFGPVTGTTPENTFNVSLGEPAGTDFQHFSDHSLQEGEVYFVRSFAVDEKNATFYGRKVSFTSLGSLAPTILAIEPTSGTWGDTLTVHGKRLGATPELVRVLINEMEVPLVYHGFDSLKVVVPDVLLSLQSTVTVVVAGNSTTAGQAFVLQAPEIHNSSQAFVSRGDTLMIQGSGFHPALIHNKTYLGAYEIKVVGAEPNSLLVLHSGYIPHGDYIFRLEVAGQQTEYQNSVKVFEPWRQLNDIPWEEHGSTVGLTFNDRGFVARILSESGYYRKVFEYCQDNDIWMPGTDYPANSLHKGFVTQEHIYALDYNAEMYQYDPSNHQWVAKNSLPATTNWMAEYATFAIGNDGYVCGGHFAESTFFNHLRKYDAETDSWSYKSNFPEPGFYHGIGFSIHGKGYAGLGLSNRYTPILNLYEYDPVLNQWSFKISLEDILFEGNVGRIIPGVFVINDKAYIFSGSRAIGISGYSHNNDLYEFDPLANTIRRLPDCPSPPRILSFSFAAAGKGYIGGGFGSSQLFTDFWEFDPERLPPPQ